MSPSVLVTEPRTRAGLPQRAVISKQDAAFARFLDRYPTFRHTFVLDELRETEFERLDRLGQVYLDYTGGGLYASSQVSNHTELLLDDVFGNPHSANPTSTRSTDLLERCRRKVLEFFNAPAADYGVVFTANASHALKLVGESYPFGPSSSLLLTFDNHNSVNGIREFARARGARTTYIPVSPPEMRVSTDAVRPYLASDGGGAHNLFAYPAQSNFSGVQHDLGWIEMAHQQGWDVLVDAAAFVPTNRLDIGQWRPDYVTLSFYKMFGYPTGCGALVVRWPALEKLQRPWFAGGTIDVASVQADRHHFAPGAAAFEDGTVNYLSLPAVETGLRFLEQVGMDRVHERVSCLTGWLLEQLLSMRHASGTPLVVLYGPPTTTDRGGTVAINVQDARGRIIDHETVEAHANRHRISLRTGCFCNPGAGELALGLSQDEINDCFVRSGGRMSYEEFRQCISADGTGAVRISVGFATNFADVWTFLQFMNEFLDEDPESPQPVGWSGVASNHDNGGV